MTINQIGIVITIFLIVLSAVLIWDELRAEQRSRAWRDDDHQQGKSKQ